MADADATFRLDASGAEKVEQVANRAEKAMTKTKGATNKAGMAVLDFSRGFEDFAVAGMRGAMNNIPGLLMNLGVGMGLTGVISVATVVIYKGVEALEAYMDKMHALNMERQEGGGFGLIDPDLMGKAFNPEAVNKAKEMESVINAIGQAQSAISHATNLSSNEQEAAIQLANAEEILALTIKGATIEGKRFAIMMQGVKAQRDMALAAQDTVAAKQQELERLMAIKKGQEEVVNAVSSESIDKIRAKQRAVYQETLKKETEGGAATASQAAKRAEQRSLSVANLMIESEFGSRKAFDIAVQDREVAKEKLKIIEKQIEKESILLNKDKASAESAEKISRLKQKQLWTLEKIESTEDRIKKEEEARQASMKSMQSQRVVDVGSMLSSQARAGLSANETKSAMDVLGVAKQQLAALKQIVRNTRNQTTAYA